MLLNDDLTKMYDFMNSLGPFSMNSQNKVTHCSVIGKKESSVRGLSHQCYSHIYTSLT